VSYTNKTKYITSIYGHIRSRSTRDGTGTNLIWKNGDTIKKGDVIGYINDNIGPQGQVNGDREEHLHMGIRLTRNTGSWAWFGYWKKGANGDYKNVAPFSQIITQLPK